MNQKSFAASSGKHLIVKLMLLENVIKNILRNSKPAPKNHTNQCVIELVQLVDQHHVG